jgi:hypothetical protein
MSDFLSDTAQQSDEEKAAAALGKAMSDGLSGKLDSFDVKTDPQGARNRALDTLHTQVYENGPSALYFPDQYSDAFTQMIQESDNPVEMRSRLASASFLADQLEKPLGDVFQDLDSASRTWFGKQLAPKDAMEALDHTWRAAWIGRDIGREGFNLWASQGKDMDAYNRLMELESKMPAEDIIKRSMPVWALKQFIQFIPSQWETSVASGAMPIAIGAGLASSLSGGTLFPAVGLTAIKLGTGALSAIAGFKMETGAIYYDLLRFQDPVSGERINPEVAWYTAAGYGMVASALEFLQFDQILKGIPGLKAGAREALQKATKEAIEDGVGKAARTGVAMRVMGKAFETMKKEAAEKGGSILVETVQETSQEFAAVVGETFARQITNKLDGTTISPMHYVEIQNRLIETAVGSLAGFTVMKAPGAMMRLTVGAAKTGSQITKAKNAIAGEEQISLDKYSEDEMQLFNERAGEKLKPGTTIQTQTVVDGEEYIYKLGDKKGGKAEASLRFEITPPEKDGDTGTVDIKGFGEGGAANSNAALIRHLAYKYPGWQINMDAKSPGQSMLKQYMTEMNPRGKDAGLQHFATPRDLPAKVTVDYVKQRIKDVKPGWSTEEVDAAANIIPAFARKLGMGADELADAMLDPRVFAPILDASAAQGPTGAIQFRRQAAWTKGLVDMSRNANPTTAIHEFTHAVVQFAQDNAHVPQVKQFLQEIETAIGVEGGNWGAEFKGWTSEYTGGNRTFLEAVTYAMEDYFATGKAPTQELEGLFAKFAQWIKELYSGLKGARVEMTPEMTAYFDELFGGKDSPYLSKGYTEDSLVQDERDAKSIGTVSKAATSPEEGELLEIYQGDRKAELQASRRDLEREKALYQGGVTEEAQAAFDSAIQVFGTTRDVYEAGYVLPDGTMIDFSGRHNATGYQKKNGKFAADKDDYLKHNRQTDHREIEWPGSPVDEAGNRNASMEAFIDMGAVRMDANSGLADMSRMPTTKQWSVIKAVIQGSGTAWVEMRDGKRTATIEADGNPAKALGYIRRFYDGQDFDSTIMFQGDETGWSNKDGTWTQDEDFAREPDYTNTEILAREESKHNQQPIDGKTGKPTDGDVLKLYQGETWKYKSEETVSQKLKGPMPGTSILKMLQNAGVKAEELKWTGLDKFLDTDEKLTPAQVMEHIQGNRLQIEEVEKKEVAYFPENTYMHPGTGSVASLEEWTDDAKQIEAEGGDSVGTTLGYLMDVSGQVNPQSPKDFPKFSQYNLPGGENYREVLFKLPTEKSTQIERRIELATIDRSRPLTEQEQSEYDMLQATDKAGAYQSGHWDESNVLAHTRLNDRTTADGKKALFIEEIQSDWHQEGKKKGYKGESVQPPTLDVVAVELYGKPYDQLDAGDKNAVELEHEGRVQGTGGATMASSGLNQVPDAPFKKTWHEFVFKRILREAVEKGYDTVAWTTGAQQADRYSLAKQVRSITYEQDPDGKYYLTAKRHDGEGLLEKNGITITEVEDFVGKEIAEKIVNGEGDFNAEEGRMELSGLDLKFGGEGMKGFYDKMIVDYANTFGKKYGAQVADTNILTDGSVNGWYVGVGFGTEGPFTKQEAEAKALAEGGEIIEMTAPGTAVHSLPVTPAMGDAISNGMMLFQGESASKASEDMRTVLSSLEAAGLAGTPLSADSGALWVRFDKDGEEYEVRIGEGPDVHGKPDHQFDGNVQTLERFIQNPEHNREFTGVQPSLDKYEIPAAFVLPENRVSVRIPTAAGGGDVTYADPGATGLETVVLSGLADKYATSMEGFSKLPRAAGEDSATYLGRIVDWMKDNLLAIYDSIPQSIRDSARHWYDAAHLVATQFATRAGISIRSASGVIATLSPQKDWNQNISQAARVVDIMSSLGSSSFDQKMTTWLTDYAATKDQKDQADILMILSGIGNKALSAMTNEEASYFVRAYDESYNDRSYRIMQPDGSFGGYATINSGAKALMVWQNFNNIAKAVSIFRDDSLQNISDNLGGQHKVRSFYNNVVQPWSGRGEITVDTHATAGAYLRPLGAASPEVTAAFGGKGSGTNAFKGLSGQTAVIQDAFRKAAAERNILAREMQSVTWVGAIQMFDGRKAPVYNDKAIKLWEEPDARTRILAEFPARPIGNETAPANGAEIYEGQLPQVVTLRTGRAGIRGSNEIGRGLGVIARRSTGVTKEIVLYQGGGDESAVAALKEIARSFQSLEEFVEYIESPLMEDERNQALGNMVPEGRQAYYRELYKASQTLDYNDIRSWADDLEKDGHKGLYDLLETIWNEVLIPSYERPGSMDADEAKQFEADRDSMEDIKSAVAETIIAAAQSVGTTGRGKLAVNFLKSLMGTIKANPEEYAQVAGKIQGNQKLEELGRKFSEEKYADIDDEKVIDPRLSISERAAIAKDILDERLAKEVLSGDLVMDDKVKEYLKKQKNEIRNLKKGLEESAKDAKSAEAKLDDRDRMVLENRRQLAEVESEIEKYNRKLEKFLANGQKIPEGYEEKIASQERAAESIRKRLVQVGDWRQMDQEMQTLVERERRNALEQQLAKAEGRDVSPSLPRTLSDTREAIRKLEPKLKLAATRWKGPASLESYLAGLQAETVVKEKIRVRDAEARAVKRLKEARQKLVRSITAKPGDSIYYKQAAAILQIQNLIDPNYRSKASMEKIQLLRMELEADPSLANEVSREWLNRATKKNLSEMTFKELEETERKIAQLREDGKAYREAQKRARLDRTDNDRIMVSGAMKAQPGYETPEGFSATKSPMEKFKGKLRQSEYAFFNMRRMARDKLDGGTDGVNVDLLVLEERKHYREEMEQRERRLVALAAAFKAAGVKPDDWYNEIIELKGVGPGRTDKSFRKSDLMAYELALKNEDSKQAVIFGNLFSHTEKREMTEDELMFEGDHRLKIIVAALTENITTADLQVLEAFERDSEETGARLSSVVGEVENRIVEIVENYFPLSRLGASGDSIAKQIADDMLNRTSGLRRGPKNGFSKSRITISPAHQTAVRLDLYSTWMTSVAKQEHYLAYAEYGKRLDAVYLDPYIQEQIKAVSGDEGIQYVADYIADVKNPMELIQHTHWENAIRYLRGNLGVAYLAFRTSSVMKQLITSPMPYLAYAGPRVLSNAMQCMANPVKFLSTVEGMSTVLQNRTQDMIHEAVKLAKADTKFGKAIVAVEKAGMMGLEFADRFSVAIGWKAVYDKALADGMSEQAAMEKADDVTLMSQPSSRSVDLSPIYRDKGEATKLLLQFTQALNVVYQNIRYDIPNAMRNHQYLHAVGLITSYMLSGVLLNLATEQPPEDEEKNLQRLVFFSLTQGLESLPLIGQDVTRLMKRAIVGETSPVMPDTALPGISELFDGMYRMVGGDWDRGIENFARGGGMILGMPVGGVREAGRTIGGDFGALAGRPKEK